MGRCLDLPDLNENSPPLVAEFSDKKMAARKDGRKGSWKVGALTPPKFNSLPLKNDVEFPLGYLPIFRGELLNFRDGIYRVLPCFLLGGAPQFGLVSIHR